MLATIVTLGLIMELTMEPKLVLMTLRAMESKLLKKSKLLKRLNQASGGRSLDSRLLKIGDKDVIVGEMGRRIGFGRL